MKKSLAPLFLSLILGIGIGALLMKTMGGSHPPAKHRTEGVTKREHSPSKSPRNKKATPQEVAGSLENLLTRIPYSLASGLPLNFSFALTNLHSDEIIAMLDELVEPPLKTDPRSSRLQKALYQRWAQLEPERAWDHIRVRSEKNRGFLVTSLMAEIAHSAPSLAQQLFTNIEDEKLKQAARSGLISVLSAHDPETALSIIQEETNPSTSNFSISQLFSTWAQIDPNTAINKLESLKETPHYSQALRAAVRTLASNDPQQAIQILSGIPEGSDRNGILSSIASIWIQNHSDQAITWISSLDPAEQSHIVQNNRHFLFNDPTQFEKWVEIFDKLLPTPNNHNPYVYSSFVKKWAEVDHTKAITWLKSLPSGPREKATQGIIDVLKKTNPQAAASLLEEEGINRDNYSDAGSLIAEWASGDENAAFEWLQGLGLSGKTKELLIENTVRGLVKKDVQRATDFVLRIDNKSEQEAAISELMERWADKDPTAAEQWLDSSLEGETRQRALISLIEEVAEKDTETALRMYENAISNIPADQEQSALKSARTEIARSLAAQDPEKATQWAFTLPEGKQRTEAMSDIIYVWGRYDIESVANFALGLNEGPERDIAAKSIVSNLRKSDPEAAFLWAASIGNQKQRERTISDSVRYWKDIDTEAARTAVQNADISEKTKERILNDLE